MAGARLDWFPEGPGINDNGSGSAALIEIAEALGRHHPQNTLRFAWWGAEEIGLVGSTEYVDGLSGKSWAHRAVLNFDMIGSPNYVFQVYDADQSTFEARSTVPKGSVAIEDLFESFYTLRDEPYDDSAFDGRSDYQAFIVTGIPSGGLFTGAEVPKTEEQVATGAARPTSSSIPATTDACDTIENFNRTRSPRTPTASPSPC